MKKISHQLGLVEIGIIGLAFVSFFASMGLFALNSARIKSRDSKRVADITLLNSALTLYVHDKDNSPNDLTEIYEYLKILPNAPMPADGICSTEDNKYKYQKTGRKDFQISFCLGEFTSGLDFGQRTSTQDGFK